MLPSCALCLVTHKKTASLIWEGLPGVVPETRRSAGSAKDDTVAVPTLKKLCLCGPPATAHKPPRRTRLEKGTGKIYEELQELFNFAYEAAKALRH